MGEEKQNVEEILRRVDELVRILKFLSDDLSEILKSLKTYLATIPTAEATRIAPPTSAQQIIPLEQPVPPLVPHEVRAVSDVQKAFPEDLSAMLYFEEAEDYVLVKPRQYLGPDNFRRIATIVRDQLGGEYVSAGKDSHFRIPRKIL